MKEARCNQPTPRPNNIFMQLQNLSQPDDATYFVAMLPRRVDFGLAVLTTKPTRSSSNNLKRKAAYMSGVEKATHFEHPVCIETLLFSSALLLRVL